MIEPGLARQTRTGIRWPGHQDPHWVGDRLPSPPCHAIHSRARAPALAKDGAQGGSEDVESWRDMIHSVDSIDMYTVKLSSFIHLS